MGLLEARSLSICVVKTIDVPIKSVLFELSALCLFREPSTHIYHLFIIRSCDAGFIASGEYIMAYLRSVEWNIVMLTHPVIGIPIHNQYIFLLQISVWVLLKAQVGRTESRGAAWAASLIVVLWPCFWSHRLRVSPSTRKPEFHYKALLPIGSSVSEPLSSVWLALTQWPLSLREAPRIIETEFRTPQLSVSFR